MRYPSNCPSFLPPSPPNHPFHNLRTPEITCRCRCRCRPVPFPPHLYIYHLPSRPKPEIALYIHTPLNRKTTHQASITSLYHIIRKPCTYAAQLNSAHADVSLCNTELAPTTQSSPFLLYAISGNRQKFAKWGGGSHGARARRSRAERDTRLGSRWKRF